VFDCYVSIVTIIYLFGFRYELLNIINTSSGTMFATKLLPIVLLCVLCINNTYGSKLNVPRVLLPVFDTFTVKFNIEVTDDGCYKW